MEKQQKFYEVYLSPPPREVTVDYTDFIFNPQLTLEFKTRYRELFGYIDTTGLNATANYRTVEAEKINRTRRVYGEYMMRRLGEYHVDNYFKSQPAMREVYELKERLSNVQVQVGPSYKMDVHYSFADNSAEIVVQNPYCDSKLRVEMDPTSIGPASIQENRLYLGKKINSQHYVLGSLAEKDGLVRVEWWNNYAFGLATQLSGSTTFRSQGITPRESSVGAAVLHSF